MITYKEKLLISLVILLMISGCKSKMETKNAVSSLKQTANELLSNGQIEPAIAILKQAAQLEPKDQETTSLLKQAELKLQQKETDKTLQVSDTITDNDIQIQLLSITRTRKIPSQVNTSLSADEEWISLQVVLLDVGNKTNQTKWRDYYHLITASGNHLSPSFPIIMTSANNTPDYILANERKELKIIFRVRSADFPVKLENINGFMINVNL